MSNRTYEYMVVNVFSEHGLYGGNQLAVFPDAAELSNTEMLGITKQFNFSEVTFVTKKQGNRAKVRIFTPGGEIPYAGHPTIGTTYELVRQYRTKKKNPRNMIHLRIERGRHKCGN